MNVNRTGQAKSSAGTTTLLPPDQLSHMSSRWDVAAGFVSAEEEGVDALELPALRFYETYSCGRGLNQWCTHRSRRAGALSDINIASHHTRRCRLERGFEHLQRAGSKPQFFVNAQRRHVQLARCAGELLLLRQSWLRQALGMAHRRWRSETTTRARLRSLAASSSARRHVRRAVSWAFESLRLWAVRRRRHLLHHSCHVPRCMRVPRSQNR